MYTYIYIYGFERIVSMFRLDAPISMCARLTNIIFVKNGLGYFWDGLNAAEVQRGATNMV